MYIAMAIASRNSNALKCRDFMTHVCKCETTYFIIVHNTSQ